MANTPPWPVLLVAGVVFLAIGLGVGREALKQYGRAFRLLTTEVVDAVSVSAGDTTAVSGAVAAREETGTVGSLFEPDAVFCYTEIQHRSAGGGAGPGGTGGSRWDTFHWNYEGVPFDIADDTGTVGVYPPDCPPDERSSVPDIEVDLPQRSTTVQSGQPLPDEVADYVERVDGLRRGREEDTIRIKQGVLVPDQEAFVLGAATSGQAGPETEVVVDGETSPGAFAVSNEQGGSPLKNVFFGLFLTPFALVSTGVGAALLYLTAQVTLGL